MQCPAELVAQQAWAHRVGAVAHTGSLDVAADPVAVALGSLATAEGAGRPSIAAVAAGRLGPTAFTVCNLGNISRG